MVRGGSNRNVPYLVPAARGRCDSYGANGLGHFGCCFPERRWPAPDGQANPVHNLLCRRYSAFCGCAGVTARLQARPRLAIQHGSPLQSTKAETFYRSLRVSISASEVGKEHRASESAIGQFIKSMPPTLAVTMNGSCSRAMNHVAVSVSRPVTARCVLLQASRNAVGAIPNGTRVLASTSTI
jgi:hypothetical protein